MHTHTHRFLVVRMKYVCEQAMLVDGTRWMRADVILNTFKVVEVLIKFIMKSRATYNQ